MPKVLLEFSMSLDGYVAGPDVGPDEPMGRGGEALHNWVFEGRSAEETQRFQTDHFRDVGALIVGRRMADLGIGPWGDEPVFHAPVFVLTHREARTVGKRGGTSYTFVTGGIDEAMRRAREAAGDKDVQVNGGADVARQCLRAGVVDELRLHLVPLVLGSGTSLFDDATPDVRLRPISAVGTPTVTHLVYEVASGSGPGTSS
jgi:dihydrofolate reductase